MLQVLERPKTKSEQKRQQSDCVAVQEQQVNEQGSERNMQKACERQEREKEREKIVAVEIR